MKRRGEATSWQNINYWNGTLSLLCEWHDWAELYGAAFFFFFVNGRGPRADSDLVDRVTSAGIQDLVG